MLTHFKNIGFNSSRTSKTIHFSPILSEVARLEKQDVFIRMETSSNGLSEIEALKRLKDTGPNVIAEDQHRAWPWHLLTATRNPLVILLIVLATISFASGDARAGTVMALMVVLGVFLRFIQEARADVRVAESMDRAARAIRSSLRSTSSTAYSEPPRENSLPYLVVELQSRTDRSTGCAPELRNGYARAKAYDR